MLFLNIRNALTVLTASVFMAVAAPGMVSAHDVAEASLTTEKIRVPVNGPIDYQCDGDGTHLEIGVLRSGVYRTKGYDEYTNLSSQNTALFACLSPNGDVQRQQVFVSAGKGFRVVELAFSADSERLTGVKAEAQ